MTMDVASIKLSDLLHHPDDLDKIPALKLEYTRKKSAVDSQLRSGLKEQLEVTQAGMHGITDGQRTVQLIKEEMMKIDKLCAEAQNMIKDFPNINLVSQTHRNFTAVETMRRNLVDFNERLTKVEGLLEEDDRDEDNMANLGRWRIIFARLDDTIDWFDEHIGKVAMNLIEVVVQGNSSLVVRLAVVIEAEEKSDKRVLALQEALKDHKEMAARFKSITDGAKSTRGYKEKFLMAIKLKAEGDIEETKQAFLEDPSKLEKSLRWFFNDLNAVKQGMVPLMPKKWKILKTYGKIYHQLMHDFLIGMIDDPDTTGSFGWTRNGVGQGFQTTHYQILGSMARSDLQNGKERF
ncbi:hypothetical protein EYC84_011077 [Monilinia fructicola]|uniref:Exocyst complex component Sec6 n=1 Tax=Monilinia fructicola TaxID=38448 RepID=A0A5M9J717_MONFR|nr:hypothetical protein EYC84_011077 [Monilinia fructicola]